MNSINMILNYLIAESRAKYYNVTDKQKVQTTALLMGAISQNTMVDYLVIENQAKNLQPKYDVKSVEIIDTSSETGNSNTNNSAENAIKIKVLTEKVEKIALMLEQNAKEMTLINTYLEKIKSELLNLLEKNRVNENKIEEILVKISKSDYPEETALPEEKAKQKRK